MTEKPTTPPEDKGRTLPENDTLVPMDSSSEPAEQSAGDRGAEDREIDEMLLGRVIEDRFEILELIGHGGFGSVYKARQSSVDRIVALKILRPLLATRGIIAQRFLLEARATSRLSNQHTVTVFDHGETKDGLLYIAMEYLPGRTLQDRIDQEGVLPTHDALRIVAEIAESLAEAHAHQIIHRDLKPENILLVDTETTEDYVKVLDFGIARAKPLTGDMTLTSTGQLSGTPPYMSPEVIRGRQVTASADVYSMAIILYQLVSGHCPFEGDTPFDIFMAHVQKSPRKLSELGIKVSRPLETFIQRCLSKDPLTRPQNAGFFLSELQAIANGTAEAGMGTRRENKKSSNDEAPPTLVQPGAPTLFTDTFNRDVQTLRARMHPENAQSRRSRWIQRGLSMGLVALFAIGTWFILNQDSSSVTTGQEKLPTPESTSAVSDTPEKKPSPAPPEEAAATPPTETPATPPTEAPATAPTEAAPPSPVISPSLEVKALASPGDAPPSSDTGNTAAKKTKIRPAAATATRQGQKRPDSPPIKNRKKPEVSKIDALLD